MSDLEQRLEAAAKRRDTLAAECRRIEGRLEAARASLAIVEEECRSKGVEPDQLDATIKAARTRLEGLVEQLERDVTAAADALAPYLKETT